jgi:hypothetical protein
VLCSGTLFHLSPAYGQSGGTIAGTVADEAGGVFPGVTVELHAGGPANRHGGRRRTFRNIADLENPTENVVSVASAASQGAITARQLEGRPIMRPAEVLEAVPDLIASQHSGEGKANQYYLRGFNLDHGSRWAACSERQRSRRTMR